MVALAATTLTRAMNVLALFLKFSVTVKDLRPLDDRIDIHIEVPAVKYRDLASREAGEPSREIKRRVDDARKIQLNRFKGMKIYCNAQMTNRHIKKFCEIDEASQKLLEMAIDKFGLSAELIHEY